jgi:hypothetical protein
MTMTVCHLENCTSIPTHILGGMPVGLTLLKNDSFTLKIHKTIYEHWKQGFPTHRPYKVTLLTITGFNIFIWIKIRNIVNKQGLPSRKALAIGTLVANGLSSPLKICTEQLFRKRLHLNAKPLSPWKVGLHHKVMSASTIR